MTATVWAPLAALRDPESRTEHLVERADLRRAFPAIRYGEDVVWGLTHRILTEFLEVATGIGV